MASLAAQLQARRARLQQTTTMVRHQDGRRELYKDGMLIGTASGGPGYVVDDKPDLQLAEVRPGLFLSSQDVPVSQPERLVELGVSRILNLSASVDYDHHTYGDRLRVVALPVLDVPETDLLAPALQSAQDPLRDKLEICRVLPSSSTLGSALLLLHRWLCMEERKALVHCNAGVSRSATAAIAYIMIFGTDDPSPPLEEPPMRHPLRTFEAAYKHCKERRPCVRPNDGFIRQLKELEAQLSVPSTELC